MPVIQTAVSLDDTLVERVEQVAEELNMSRSRLVTLALEEFLRRHDSRNLLETLNAALGEESIEPFESSHLEEMRRYYRRQMVDQW
jgi:metal-responsive CopG/Arc/MetJ family transcriptional regulator